MLSTLLKNSRNFSIRHNHSLIVRELTLVDFTVAVHSCCSGASSFFLSLLAFDSELTMWVALRILLSDVSGDQPRHPTNDYSDIINNDLAVLITLQKEQLSGFLIIVSVDCRYWHLLFDTHVVQLSHELLVAGVRLERRW